MSKKENMNIYIISPVPLNTYFFCEIIAGKKVIPPEMRFDFQQKSFTSSGNVQLEIFTLKIIYFENIKNFLRQNPEPIVRIYGLYSISSIFDEKSTIQQRWY